MERPKELNAVVSNSEPKDVDLHDEDANAECPFEWLHCLPMHPHLDEKIQSKSENDWNGTSQSEVAANRARVH